MIPPLHLTLPSPDATDRLAERLAPRLRAGDCLLLSGPVGAGKSHLSRALIRALLDAPEDIPSPTFTLVQTYDTRAGEIWHADLYRLGDLSEIDELGLTEAFASAICLVEWPDRLGEAAPASALALDIRPDPEDDERRHIDIGWTDPAWSARLEDLND